MTPEAFLDYWAHTYGGRPPEGQRLRKQLPARWFRIHSLPDSERYAHNLKEWRELLMRQNTLCGEVLGEGQPFTLVFDAIYTGPDGEINDRNMKRPQLRDLEAHHLLTLPIHEWRDDPDFEEIGTVELRMIELTWQQGLLDPVLRDAARWDILGPLLVSTARDRIVTPYDGGVDVILESAPVRDAFHARFIEWASPFPTGL